jgi:hypothetical protein
MQGGRDRLNAEVIYGGPIRGFTGGFFPGSAQYVTASSSVKVRAMVLIYICKFRELEYVHRFQQFTVWIYVK